mmetsp:Transcript_31029/g.85512  ORF Transcript_31029/g.85512 Transcript_31029/m.85512 type:complete len:206 (-) Transcript_31029:628-1245(-)
MTSSEISSDGTSIRPLATGVPPAESEMLPERPVRSFTAALGTIACLANAATTVSAMDARSEVVAPSRPGSLITTAATCDACPMRSWYSFMVMGFCVLCMGSWKRPASKAWKNSMASTSLSRLISKRAKTSSACMMERGGLSRSVALTNSSSCERSSLFASNAAKASRGESRSAGPIRFLNSSMLTGPVSRVFSVVVVVLSSVVEV